VLQNANDIRVRCVLIRSIEVPETKGLVLPGDIALVHTHFDPAIDVLAQIRQWYHRLVEELFKHVAKERLLVGIALLDGKDAFKCIGLGSIEGTRT